jgi:hypothetical protein
LLGPEAGQGARPAASGVGSTSVWNSPPLRTHEASAPISQIPSAGLQSRRLEVDDDVRRVLEEECRAGRLRESDGISVPREPRIRLDDVRQKGARQRNGRLPEGEKPPCRLLREHRPALLLDELHEPVGRV